MKTSVCIRNIAGGVLVALGAMLIVQREMDTGERLGFLLIGFALLISGVIVFSGSLTGLASRPLTGLIDRIYFGNNQAEPPPVTLKLARIYRQERRHADAINECERQLEYHPRSPELWAELVRSARESGDAELLTKSERQVRRRLKGEDWERFEQEVARRGAWAGYGEWKALR